jgi:hypothetical protein
MTDQSSNDHNTTAPVKPEDFHVTSDRDGERDLECPDVRCGWSVPVGRDHYDPRYPIPADLGPMLEAARAHIADAHREDAA